MNKFRAHRRLETDRQKMLQAAIKIGFGRICQRDNLLAGLGLGILARIGSGAHAMRVSGQLAKPVAISRNRRINATAVILRQQLRQRRILDRLDDASMPLLA